MKLKMKYLKDYLAQFCSILHEQCSRVLIIKLVRCIPEAVLPKIQFGRTQGNSKSEQDHHKEDAAQNAESMVDVENGKSLRLWVAPQPLDILSLHHRSKAAEFEVSTVCNSVFSKLFHVYALIREIMHISFVLGEILNNRGREQSRQLLLQMKKEILNFGSPVSPEKLMNYLSLRWMVLRLRFLGSLLASSYCLLISSTLHPDMSSFFTIFHCHHKMKTYASDQANVIPFSLPQLFSFELKALGSLSTSDKKICSEKFNEVR
jgi:hypothetical protein